MTDQRTFRPSSFIARRRFLQAAPALTGAMVAGAWPAAWGQAGRQNRVVVPFTAGGSSDQLARIVAQHLPTRDGASKFIVDNKPGASGSIAASDVLRSPADGSSMLTITPSFPISQYVYPNLPYNVARDFTPVGLILTTPLILVVHPSLNVKTPAEFLALARQKNSPITYSTAGTGTVPHVALESLRMIAGLQMMHVPYKGGGESVNALLSGQVNTSLLTPVETDAYVKSGKMIAVASTSAQRSPSLPNLPTLAEAGATGYDVTYYTGLAVRSATPPDILARLSADLQEALRSPALHAQLSKIGDVASGTVAEAKAMLDKDHARWSQVVRDAGIVSS